MPKKKTDTNVSDNDKGLELALSAINKQFGEGAVIKLGEATHQNVPILSTGNLIIDKALGVGGMPRGRICEIYGPESSGKTTFCLNLIAQAQKLGENCAFIDVEHAVDPRYAKVIGVQLDKLIFSQPDCGEDALTIAENLINSGSIKVVVIDSVAALIPRKELEGEMGDANVGAQARLMSQAMRRLTAVVNRTGCICLFTNQIREKIGVMFGSPEQTPGGRALKFFSSVRIDIRRIASIKNVQGTVVGNRTKLKIVKNKVAPPFTECEFDIIYSEGISHFNSLIDLALETNVLDKKGSWISFEGNLIGQGKEQVRVQLDSDPALVAKIKEKLDQFTIGLDGKVVEKATVSNPEKDEKS